MFRSVLMLPLSMLIPSLLGACGTSTNFTQNTTPATGGGQPILDISAESLEFSDVEVGIVGSQTLIITSAGDSPLEISRIRLTNSAEEQFYIQEYDLFTLDPESTKEIIVTVTLAEIGYTEGELQIRSNDADFRDLRVPLLAYTTGEAPE